MRWSGVRERTAVVETTGLLPTFTAAELEGWLATRPTLPYTRRRRTPLGRDLRSRDPTRSSAPSERHVDRGREVNRALDRTPPLAAPRLHAAGPQTPAGAL